MKWDARSLLRFRTTAKVIASPPMHDILVYQFLKLGVEYVMLSRIIHNLFPNQGSSFAGH